MPYKMNPKQYESVLALSSKERYSHFIGKVADWEQLWGLFNEKEGWLIREIQDDIKYFSVWPHPQYASEISKEFYPNYLEKEISLSEFMNHWLPQFESDKIKIGVFPNMEGDSWLMEPNDLLLDLQEECKLYE